MIELCEHIYKISSKLPVKTHPSSDPDTHSKDSPLNSLTSSIWKPQRMKETYGIRFATIGMESTMM